MSTRDWDGTAYERVSSPQENWARVVLDRLPLEGHETVLDAGCGSGRVTQLLLERLPEGHVVGVDGAPGMIEEARANLDPDRTTLFVADLAAMRIDEPVDAAFSNAVFHWVPDHDALFAGLAEVLKPGGRLVTDCGGRGNVAAVSAAVDEILGPQPSPWNFAGVADTEERLRRAGFTDLDVRLRPDPARLADEAQLLDYLGTVVLGGQLDRMPPEEHDGFVRAVAVRLPEPVVDYVRLEITATRA
jgi:trans-aconitate 2-methyltransferase